MGTTPKRPPTSGDSTARTPSPAPVGPDRPPLFPLGGVFATPGALDLLQTQGVDGLMLLRRHVTGDWGDCCAEDVQANNQALQSGARIFSVYKLQHVRKGGRGEPPRIWIITEADRSSTTLLLPEDY